MLAAPHWAGEVCGGSQRSMGGCASDVLERRVSVERVFVEQIELLVIRFWPEGLVVTADLGEVGCLELQGDLHEHVGDVSGGLIGDGVFGQVVRMRSRHRGDLYSSTSSFMRKLLPSMIIVSTWCMMRSRMADVSVLSLLKICAQCL